VNKPVERAEQWFVDLLGLLVASYDSTLFLTYWFLTEHRFTCNEYTSFTFAVHVR